MKKTRYLSMIISALTLCCIFLFSACISAPSKADGAKTGNKNGVLAVEVVPDKKTTDRFEYSVELPAFPDYPELTAVVRDIHNKRFADFNALSAENFTVQDKNNRALHTFYMNWASAELSENLISIKLETHEYTGGANGMTYIDVVNWLPAKNKQLTFEQIPSFLGLKYTKAQWLDYLSKNSRDVLENKLNGKKNTSLSEFIAAGTEPEVENLKNITISGKEITVWFQKYQAAPGSEGIVSAVINTANIR